MILLVSGVWFRSQWVKIDLLQNNKNLFFLGPYSNDGDSKWSPCKWMKDAFCLWWLGDMHWEWASSPLQESNSDLLIANFWMLYHWGVGNVWDLEPWTMYAWVAILLFFCTARLKLSINCVQLISQQCFVFTKYRYWQNAKMAADKLFFLSLCVY